VAVALVVKLVAEEAEALVPMVVIKVLAVLAPVVLLLELQ
jgi:hypothetical protein